MRLRNLFPTPIWVDDLSFDFDSVVDKCHRLKTNGVIKSNFGGFQSDFIDLSQFDEFYSLLLNKIDSVCHQIDPNFKLKIGDAWININNKGDYNVPHVHPNSAMSGVLYIKVDDLTGNIIFNSNSLMEHYPFNPIDSKLFPERSWVTPRNGSLIIFPSWLRHEVQPSESNSERISIAFNTTQI